MFDVSRSKLSETETRVLVLTCIWVLDEEVSKILIPRKKTAVAFSPESEEKTPRFARRSSGIGSSRSESALKTPVVVKKRHRNAHQPFKSPLKRVSLSHSSKLD